MSSHATLEIDSSILLLARLLHACTQFRIWAWDFSVKARS
jgi:hypothetical protein